MFAALLSVRRYWPSILLALLVSLPAGADDISGAPVSLLSIIIDDLGDVRQPGLRAVALPGSVTCSILPHTPYARTLATRAHAVHKEVMLHLPMESETGRYTSEGMLSRAMDWNAFSTAVQAALRSVPYVDGVNNHMGSLLTQQPGYMAWLMQLLKQQALYFVDSRTTPRSVAYQVASDSGVTHISRDVFLDVDRRPEVIQAQLDRVIALSRQRGKALAIGHPYPETLAALESWLPALAAQGIKLVSVSDLITMHKQPGARQWQTSLSLSPRVAKNLKP